jgi:hypothetical protein
MGLSAAALRAGYQPKKRPTAAEKIKDKRIEGTVITTGQSPDNRINKKCETEKNRMLKAVSNE